VIAVRVSKPSGKQGLQSVVWYALGFVGDNLNLCIDTATIEDVVAISHLDGNAHINDDGWEYAGRIPDFSSDSWPVFPVIERNGMDLWMDNDDLEMREFNTSIIDKKDQVFFRQLAGDCSAGYLSDIVLSEIQKPLSTRHGVRFTREHLEAHREYAARIRADMERRRKRDLKQRTLATSVKKAKGPVEFWSLMDIGVYGVTVEGSRDKPATTKRQFLNAVRKHLAVASRAEAKTFGMSMGTALAEARSWKIWSAAYIMNGGCSEDGFLYFRLWLLAQGRRVYSKALLDPESLASATLRFGKPGDFEFEELLEVVDDTIGEFDLAVNELCDEMDALPKGVAPAFRAESLSRLYPSLWAKFA
jgi:hypothetical protein